MAVPSPEREEFQPPPPILGPGTWARAAALAAGLWLFCSAFIWQQPHPARVNAWAVGLAIAVVAAGAVFVQRLRYVNTALAIWLAISSRAVFHLSQTPLFNDVVVAIIVFAMTLVPDESDRPPRILPTPGG